MSTLKNVLALAVSVPVLVACGSLADTPANTPLARVVAQYGSPTLQCTNAQGQSRVIWSQQPLGQYAWGGEVDAQGRVQHITQLLTDAHFKILDQGTWTPDAVQCEFGPPAFIDTVGLPSNRQWVYNYRYKQDHVWNSLMFVFFDPDTGHVTRHHPGPDPMYEYRDILQPF